MITDRKKAPACLRYNVSNNSGSINKKRMIFIDHVFK